jgi:hypothetical protein
MTKGKPDRLISTRMLFAVVALSLLALRGVGFIGVAAFPSPSPISGQISFVQALDANHCESDQNDPLGKRHGKHPECCFLCMSAARDILDAAAFVAAGEIEFAFPVSSRSDLSIARRSIAPRPAGLIATWSATSPPALV